MIHDNSKKIDFFHGIFWRFRKRPYLCTVFKRERQQNQIKRALSSVGSERLPYKQRVGGSNPSAPTY